MDTSAGEQQTHETVVCLARQAVCIQSGFGGLLEVNADPGVNPGFPRQDTVAENNVEIYNLIHCY